MVSERNRLLVLCRGRRGQRKWGKEMNHAKRSSTKLNTGTFVFSLIPFIQMKNLLVTENCDFYGCHLLPLYECMKVFQLTSIHQNKEINRNNHREAMCISNILYIKKNKSRKKKYYYVWNVGWKAVIDGNWKSNDPNTSKPGLKVEEGDTIRAGRLCVALSFIKLSSVTCFGQRTLNSRSLHKPNRIHC